MRDVSIAPIPAGGSSASAELLPEPPRAGSGAPDGSS